MKTLERKTESLISGQQFAKRMAIYFGFGLCFLIISLAIGTMGYAYFAKLPFVDAFLNASMILTGMGPVNRMTTTSGKLFSAFYALYSGVAFLTFVAVLFTPIYHRFIHKFHLDLDEN
jgi:hypothetical protein